MATDRMALIRELSRYVGHPDFLRVADRIRLQLAATGEAEHAPKPARAPEREMRRPSTTRRCA
ncbi:MAG TPA: hypothetical protein VGE72_29290 [Azospirillum sp.]